MGRGSCAHPAKREGCLSGKRGFFHPAPSLGQLKSHWDPGKAARGPHTAVGIPGHTLLSLHPIPELVKAPPPRLMLPDRSLQRSPSWGIPSQDPRTSTRAQGARTETRKVDSEIQTDARKSQSDRQENPLATETTQS